MQATLLYVHILYSCTGNFAICTIIVSLLLSMYLIIMHRQLCIWFTLDIINNPYVQAELFSRTYSPFHISLPLYSVHAKKMMVGNNETGYIWLDYSSLHSPQKIKESIIHYLKPSDSINSIQAISIFLTGIQSTCTLPVRNL